MTNNLPAGIKLTGKKRVALTERTQQAEDNRMKNRQGKISTEYFTPVEIGALYWHLVDLVWIYLFPLLYLVG